MTLEKALSFTESLLVASLHNFKDALELHIPFGFSKDGKYIKYIPERCLTTYFAHELINHGFVVFNEQPLASETEASQKIDLLARKFSKGRKKEQIQLCVEAKGNLDSGYTTILADIERMQNSSLDLRAPSGFANAQADDFGHQFHIVITTDWGLHKLSDWWMSKSKYMPNGTMHPDGRTECWIPLNQKLLDAKKCGGLTLLKNSVHDYEVKALYAIF